MCVCVCVCVCFFFLCVGYGASPPGGCSGRVAHGKGVKQALASVKRRAVGPGEELVGAAGDERLEEHRAPLGVVCSVGPGGGHCVEHTPQGQAGMFQ
jgi:hypothetical protein